MKRIVLLYLVGAGLFTLYTLQSGGPVKAWRSLGWAWLFAFAVSVSVYEIDRRLKKAREKSADRTR